MQQHNIQLGMASGMLNLCRRRSARRGDKLGSGLDRNEDGDSEEHTNGVGGDGIDGSVGGGGDRLDCIATFSFYA
jgi:hypothetical protein